MDSKTKGAWIVHHTKKLANVTVGSLDFEQISLAGKCGVLLNSLATSDTVTVPIEKVHAFARAAHISVRTELPVLLGELQKQRFLEQGDNSISVLGLTTAQTLTHTSKIFDEIEPSQEEKAALHLSELSSNAPVSASEATEIISDTYQLSTKATTSLFTQFQDIGFVDMETVADEQLLFNGNLFRRNELAKIKGVLSSFATADELKVNELMAALQHSGCLSYKAAERIVGAELLKSLISIGFVDVNRIGNEQGVFAYITRPAAFKKFSDATVDDAFDLAKAFVTSITYGMKSSPFMRGRITKVIRLLEALIAGRTIGPATAIGQDYQYLETRGVIATLPEGDGRFYMRLLKKDIGEIALKVISEGEASSSMLLQLPSVSAAIYEGPEANRVVTRKKLTQTLKNSAGRILDTIRHGEW
jgi:hypothetical protein